MSDDTSPSAGSMEFDTACTSHPVCPHCGHEHHDAHEWSGGGLNGQHHDCDSCGEPFIAQRDVSVTWDTYKAAPPFGRCEKCGKPITSFHNIAGCKAERKP